MEQYICPDCGANMETINEPINEPGIIGKFLNLKCPKCCFVMRKSRYDFIRDIGKYGQAVISQEQTKKVVVLSKNEVTGICKSGTSKGKKLVCQFKNGIDTQLISADEILQWMNSDKYVYGKTWRCWSDTPSLQQEKETPWEALWETDGSTSKPPLGCAPRYTYVCSRIEDLCNAIVRCYADWKPNHNKIALWCKEIMYLNEMDRSLRYEEKRKVWKEDKDGHFQEVP